MRQKDQAFLYKFGHVSNQTIQTIQTITTMQQGSKANSMGDCFHWRKVIENWINVAVLLCFLEREFAAEILGDLAALLFYALKWYNWQ